jgi:predicted methyltransferase
VKKKFLISISFLCSAILGIIILALLIKIDRPFFHLGKLSSYKTFLVKERDIVYRPDTVIRLLDIKPGSIIADIEPGSGYWTFKLAKAAGPGGYVYAVETFFDWNEKWITLVVNQIKDKRTNPLDNVRFIRSPVDYIGLEPESLDLAFLCQTAMFLHRPEDLLGFNPRKVAKLKWMAKPQKKLLKSIYDAVKPGGRVAVIDTFESPITSKLRYDPAKGTYGPLYVAKNIQTVIDNYEAAGFRLIHDYPIFRNEEHLKDIEEFKRQRVYKSINYRMQCLFENEMVFLVFEKPLNAELK